MLKNLVIAFLALTTLLFAGLFLARPPLGSGSGQTHIFPEYFLAGANVPVEKDSDATTPSLTGASTASSTRTLTATEVCNHDTIINIGIRTASGTVTFPTAANMIANCLSDVADVVRFTVFNSTSSAQNRFTFVAGASSSIITPLDQSTSSPAAWLGATSTIGGGGIAEVKGYRITSSSAPWVLWAITAFGY